MRKHLCSMWRSWCVAGVLAVLACQATAVGPSPKPSAADISRTVRELGDDSFAVRERASRFLWSAGRAAEPALVAARSNADREISSRAEAILEQFKWGLYPDTPLDVQKLIHEYQRNLFGDPSTGRDADDPRNKRVQEKLREKGPPGYWALYKIGLADPAGRHGVYRELVWAVHVECQKWLEQRVMEETAGALSGKASPPSNQGERLLDGMVAVLDWPPEALADCEAESYAYQLVRTKAVLGLIRGDLANQLATFESDRLPAVTGQQALEAAILARAAGKPMLAARLAERSGDQALQKCMLFEDRDWPALWQRSQAQERAGELTYTALTNLLRTSGPISEEQARQQRIVARGERAALASRVGETHLFESLIAQLKEFDYKDAPKDIDISYRVNALVGNGRTEDAIELLKKAGQLDGAIDLLLVRLRYHEAVELASRTDNPKVDERWQWDLARAGLWSTLGEHDKATPYFEKAIKDPAAQADWIDAILQAGRRDLLLTQAARWRLDDANDGSLELLLKGLFPDNEKDANVWWRVLRVAQPDDSLDKTLKRIEDLLNGRATAAEIQSYVTGAAKAKGEAKVKKPILMLVSASAYHAMGRDDLAQAAVATLDRSTCNQDELIGLGDLAAFRQDWTAAIGCYEAAWKKWPGHDEQDDSITEKRGMAALALYLEGKMLIKSGQTERGNRLQELAHWLPLADEGARGRFRAALEERHEQDATYREMELVWRIGSLNTWVGRLGLARSWGAKRNYQSTANLWEQVLLERMHRASSPAICRYLSLWHRNLAQAHLQAGRVKECIQEAKIAEVASPADVDIAIALCPQLERAGQGAEAERLYQRMFEQHKKVTLEYPRSAWLHNDLAWLAVRCHRNLDEALSHARRAVELSPERPEFIDTLAEAQFQSGSQSEAIENARRCVRLDPRKEYYKKQRARMEKGDTSADVPAAD